MCNNKDEVNIMLTISVHNVLSQLENVPPNLQNYLVQKLSYTVDAFSYSEKPSTKYLFNPKTGMTYSGLVPNIMKILKRNKIEFEVFDMRKVPTKNGNFAILPKFKARDYQQEIIDRVNNRELIQAATGAGKTFVMASLIEKFNVSPTVIVAPKVSLMVQIKTEMEKFFGTEVGMVGGGYSTICPLTVVTPLSAPIELIRGAKAILWDEAHNIPSNTIFSLSTNAINAYYRVGVSATPWRDYGDDILIEAAISKLKPENSISASKLIKIGKLVPCNIYFKRVNSNVTWMGNYSDTYDAAIVNNPIRNKMIIDTAMNSYNKNKHILILVSRVGHGELLLKMLKQRIAYETTLVDGEKIGNVEFLSGEDSNEFRDATFKAIKNDFCKILIGTTIADEGLDVPCLDVLILAGAGKSSTKAFQRVGRVLRLYENKLYAEVYDFIDSYETFRRHAMTRFALYETEPEWKIKIV